VVCIFAREPRGCVSLGWKCAQTNFPTSQSVGMLNLTCLAQTHKHTNTHKHTQTHKHTNTQTQKHTRSLSLLVHPIMALISPLFSSAVHGDAQQGRVDHRAAVAQGTGEAHDADEIQERACSGSESRAWRQVSGMRREKGPHW
jgi:hypothetical protein